MRTLKFKFLFFIAIASASATFLNAQTHIAESKSIVGIWRMTGIMTEDGFTKINGNTYKVITSDGYYYSISTAVDIVTKLEGHATQTVSYPPMITGYGTYTILSDSTYVEHVIFNTNTFINGWDIDMKYELPDENTLKSQYKINDIWNPEKFERVRIGNKAFAGQLTNN